MSFFNRLQDGLKKSREKLGESLNVLFEMGPDVDPEFWDELEERLILADMGGAASADLVADIQDFATRKAIWGEQGLRDAFIDKIASFFVPVEQDPFSSKRACILFVGINGAGKTTTVGKLAKEAQDQGRSVLIGSADTFRAAAIEQLEVWASRASVDIVKRERGSDPASVCYDALDKAEQEGTELVLIDTAGRLHTSADLMRELAKVVQVSRKRASGLMDVYVVLVIDATTGQNGLAQAREFNAALGLDGLILTKLDGTAKGGIAVAIAHDLKLPLYRIGVGEQIEDLKPFVAQDFAKALIGQSKDS